MAKKEKKVEIVFKTPKRKQPVFRITRKVLKLFYKVKTIENLNGEPLPNKCIIVSNHSAKTGPMCMELYFPCFCAKWGAYQMLGNYNMRFHYLRDIFYMQKQGFSKFKATPKAAFEALFSILFYRGMKILPTFTDSRLRKTLQYSMDVLDNDMAVMVFPENSNEGYFDEMTQFFPGFVMLAETYYKKTGEDVPVYPVYYSKKHKKIVIGKPLQVQELAKEGMDRYQIAERFKDEVNGLYHEHIVK